jgi:hypothetical protein
MVPDQLHNGSRRLTFNPAYPVNSPPKAETAGRKEILALALASIFRYASATLARLSE